MKQLRKPMAPFILGISQPPPQATSQAKWHYSTSFEAQATLALSNHRLPKRYVRHQEPMPHYPHY
jgi:hypothetical protein